MATSLHPLRLEYIKFIKERYDIDIGGDKAPERTEVIAQDILKLGVDYRTFVRLAVTLWDDWCIKTNKEYPYWNIVTSRKSMERVQAIIALAGDILPLVDDELDDRFTIELIYAMTYVNWYCNGGVRPTRLGTRPTIEIRERVAGYICQLEGVPYISSNYNYVANLVRLIRYVRSGIDT